MKADISSVSCKTCPELRTLVLLNHLANFFWKLLASVTTAKMECLSPLQLRFSSFKDVDQIWYPLLNEALCIRSIQVSFLQYRPWDGTGFWCCALTISMHFVLRTYCLVKVRYALQACSAAVAEIGLRLELVLSQCSSTVRTCSWRDRPTLIWHYAAHWNYLACSLPTQLNDWQVFFM